MSWTPLALAALLTALLAAAGCTSTVNGSGKPAPAASTATSGPTGFPSSATATLPSSPLTPSSPSSPPSSSTPVPVSGARFTDPAQVAAIKADAARDLELTNSYSYRDLPAALRRGLSRTTGTFSAQYRRAFTTLIAPAARQHRVSQTVVVRAVGVGGLVGDTVTALAAVDVTIRRAGSAPRSTVEAVAATVQQVRGSWLVAREALGGGGSGAPAGTSGLTTAYRTASTGVTDLLSFRRAHFTADYQRALAITTGSLRTDVARNRARTRQALTAGKYDLSAVVMGEAAVSAGGRSAVFIVVVRGYRSTKPNQPTTQTLVVATTEVGTKWLVSEVMTVGVK